MQSCFVHQVRLVVVFLGVLLRLLLLLELVNSRGPYKQRLVVSYDVFLDCLLH